MPSTTLNPFHQGGSEGAQIYTELGTGTAYGTTAVPTTTSPVTVALNSDGLSAVNGAVAQGTLDIRATFAPGATTADYIFGCSDILPRSAVKLVLEVDSSVVTSTTLEKTDLRVSWDQWPGVAEPTVSGGTYRTSNTANDQAIYRSRARRCCGSRGSLRSHDPDVRGVDVRRPGPPPHHRSRDIRSTRPWARLPEPCRT
jgi:hypothetical protein